MPDDVAEDVSLHAVVWAEVSIIRARNGRLNRTEAGIVQLLLTYAAPST